MATFKEVKMKQLLLIPMAVLALAGCVGPKVYPPEYKVPLCIAFQMLSKGSSTPEDSMKYGQMYESYKTSLPPNEEKAVSDSAEKYIHALYGTSVAWVVEHDSLRMMRRAVLAPAAGETKNGRVLHNDYELWQELRNQRRGFVVGIVYSRAIAFWEGDYDAGVEAVNRFYSTPENRTVPVTAALYLMNRKQNHGISDEEFAARAGLMRKAAQDQATEEDKQK